MGKSIYQCCLLVVYVSEWIIRLVFIFLFVLLCLGQTAKQKKKLNLGCPSLLALSSLISDRMQFFYFVDVNVFFFCLFFYLVIINRQLKVRL